VRYLVNAEATWKNGVSASYDALENRLYIRNAQGGWTGGVAPGIGRKLRSAYGTLDAAKTTVTRSGDTLVVR
jgi:hypothetical protein